MISDIVQDCGAGQAPRSVSQQEIDAVIEKALEPFRGLPAMPTVKERMIVAALHALNKRFPWMPAELHDEIAERLRAALL
jgi:hypothetical protein